MNREKIKNILIFNPFGIGDCLFTTPLLRNLRENFPQSKILFIANARTQYLLKNNPFLDKVLVFEKDNWRRLAKKGKILIMKKFIKFFKEIKRQNYSLGFDLSLNPKYSLFLKLAGVKNLVGFNFRNRGKFLDRKINIPSGYEGKHISTFYLELLKLLDIKYKNYPFGVFLKKEEKQKVKVLLKENGISENDFLVAVSPGGGETWGDNAYYKHWPYFNLLCKFLKSKYSAKIIYLGSKKDKKFISSLPEGIIDFLGKLNILETAALINYANLVISNDGGIFHLAQGLNKKIIVFFGPVDEKVYGVWGNSANTLLFSKKLPCRPCYREFKFKGCIYDKKCLKDITPEEVIKEIEQFPIKIPG